MLLAGDVIFFCSSASEAQMAFKFNLGDRVVGNQTKAPFRDRSGTVSQRGPGRSEYCVRFDDRRIEWVSSHWIDGRQPCQRKKRPRCRDEAQIRVIPVGRPSGVGRSTESHQQPDSFLVSVSHRKAVGKLTVSNQVPDSRLDADRGLSEFA